MISENWATILEPGLRAVFFMQMAESVGDGGVGRLFNEVDSNEANESTLGVGGMSDVPAYKGTIEYDSYDPQYEKTFTHEEFAKGIAVARNLIDDGKYNVIAQRVRGLALAFGRTRRKHQSSVFNLAFTTVKTGDAKALCATDHPTSKQRGGTQSNRGVLPLTHDNVITTRQLMKAFTDDRGELVTIVPNTLVVPTTLEATAWTIVNSMNKSGTANNDANFNRQIGWNVIVDDYLTDANDWFMADSGLAKMHLWWFNRVMPDYKVDPSSDFDLVARFRGYMRYSFGPDDWRWIFGNIVP
jgi:hypothetical protein